MNWLESRTFKVLSFVVLFFFCWTFGGLFDIAYAVKESSQKSESRIQKTKKQKSEEKFSKTIEDIDEIVEEVAKAENLDDKKIKKNKLKAKKLEIEELDVEIKKQFAETERKLKDAGLPPEILQRHYDFVKQYEDNLNELKTNLDDIEKAEGKAEVEAEIEKTKQFLKKVKPPKKHTPLDPNKLPHRTPDAVFKEPRLNKEQFLEDRGQISVVPVNPNGLGHGAPKGRDFRFATTGSSQGITNNQQLTTNNRSILVASNSPLSGILDSLTSNPQTLSPALYAQADTSTSSVQAPPTAGDLAETIEVQFTPAITAKATELQNNPVKIYNWVRNNIEFVPTYGSIQGADYCLQTKLCNAFDTASLLIALLRVSGIHARYVEGTVEIPIEKVKNWAGGFTDSIAAIDLLASAGIPTTGMLVGGEVKYVRIEHVWVEAYVPYGPYSGRPSNLNPPKTWIPLDPSFKQYTYTDGIGLQTEVPFDTQGFIDQIQSTATINETESYVTNIDSNYIQTILTNYQTQLQDYIDQNMPDATVEDILGKKEIKKQELGILPTTLSYKKIVTGNKYSEIPDSLRHKVTFTIIDPYLFETSLSYTASIPELAGKRISLNYIPATDADKNLLDSYVQNYATSVPAYLVNLKAELKIDNTVIATGPHITMGTDQILNLIFSTPTKSETETHLMIAGDYNVIGLNIGGSKVTFERRIEQSDFSDPVSEMLYQTITAYWAEYDTLSAIYAKVYKVASVRLPSEGLSTIPVNIKYMFGVPYMGYYAGKGLDVKRDKAAILALDGDKEKAKGFNQSTGIIGSLFEGVIFDQLFGYEIGDGISAVRILELANSQGIPIYHINTENISTILPQLQISSSAINDIKNGINAGKEIIVPESNITHEGWTGIGYIVLDPEVGDGGYIIEGGTAGAIYMHAARTSAAFGERPHVDDVKIAIDDWTNAVGPVAMAGITAEIGIDIAALLALAKAILALMTILMIIVYVSVIIDSISRSRIPPNFKIFRHYTTWEGKAGIIKLMMIFASPGGDLGPGAYVTDFFLEPDGGGPGSNSEKIANAINKYPDTLIQTYVTLKIDIVRRPLVNGAYMNEPWQWVHPHVGLLIDGKTVILMP